MNRIPFSTAPILAGLVLLVLSGFGPVPVRAQSAQRTGGVGGVQLAAQITASLPDTIPLFPLPDIALFPGVRQPLHIFEPRYRAMVADALAGDRVIGMVMLRPGYEDDYLGNPPTHAVGGAGVIESVEALPDGRYNIVLQGVARFTIESEDTDGPYRLAHVEGIPERLSDEDRVRLSRQRSRLVELLRSIAPDLQLPSTLSDEDFVNSLCQFLPFEPADRQALLEAEDALVRAAALMELLGTTRQAHSDGPSLRRRLGQAR